MRNFLSMNLNLEMTVERSNRRSSYFLSLGFVATFFKILITKRGRSQKKVMTEAMFIVKYSS